MTRYVFYRAALYSVLAAHVAATFGAAAMGRVLGCVFFVGALANLLIYPISALTYSRLLGGDWRWANGASPRSPFRATTARARGRLPDWQLLCPSREILIVLHLGALAPGGAFLLLCGPALLLPPLAAPAPAPVPPTGGAASREGGKSGRAAERPEDDDDAADAHRPGGSDDDDRELIEVTLAITKAPSAGRAPS